MKTQHSHTFSGVFLVPIMENQSLLHTYTFGSLKHFQTLSCDVHLMNEFNVSIPAPTQYDSIYFLSSAIFWFSYLLLAAAALF